MHKKCGVAEWSSVTIWWRRSRYTEAWSGSLWPGQSLRSWPAPAPCTAGSLASCPGGRNLAARPMHMLEKLALCYAHNKFGLTTKAEYTLHAHTSVTHSSHRYKSGRHHKQRRLLCNRSHSNGSTLNGKNDITEANEWQSEASYHACAQKPTQKSLETWCS